LLLWVEVILIITSAQNVETSMKSMTETKIILPSTSYVKVV